MKNDEIKQKFDELNSREAVEQTMLSWVQTCFTLISLGFGVASVIIFMESHHYEKVIVKMMKILGPFLIMLGIIAAILALVQYKSKIKSIGGKRKPYMVNLLLFMGIMVSVLGIIAFFTVLIHMFF